MFRQRLLVTLVLGPLGLYLVYLGGWFYILPVVLFLALAAVEYSRLAAKLSWRVPLWIFLPLAMAFWMLTIPDLLGLDLPTINYIPHLLLAGLFIPLCYVLWLYEKRPQENALGSWLALVIGIMLLGWLASHFLRLRSLDDMAVQWTILTLMASWSADGSAYLVGKSIGRHKLSPRLSPKKTIEGYLGGIVFGILIPAITATILGMDTITVIILSLIICVLSPVGDLGISLIKREADVKDSGQLLPGHGGALDRIDSTVWSVTIAFYLIPILTK